MGDAVVPSQIVADALDWSAAVRPDTAVVDAGYSTVRVRFSPGWVRFLLPDR